jgi:hypothetical protein
VRRAAAHDARAHHDHVEPLGRRSCHGCNLFLRLYVRACSLRACWKWRVCEVRQRRGNEPAVDRPVLKDRLEIPRARSVIQNQKSVAEQVLTARPYYYF